MWYPWKKKREYDDPIRVAAFDRTPKPEPPKSTHVGVFYSKTKKRWIARKYDHHKIITIGTFASEDEAVFALNKYERLDDFNSAAKDSGKWSALSKQSHMSILERRK